MVASSAKDNKTLPENVLTDDEAVWAPAVRCWCCSPNFLYITFRTGPGWINYIQFQFSTPTLVKEVAESISHYTLSEGDPEVLHSAGHICRGLAPQF